MELERPVALSVIRLAGLKNMGSDPMGRAQDTNVLQRNALSWLRPQRSLRTRLASCWWPSGGLIWPSTLGDPSGDRGSRSARPRKSSRS